MSATAARHITAAERRKLALELRRTGASYQQIADNLGVTRAAAHKSVLKALEQLAKDIDTDAASVRALELERLDRLQMGLWRTATGGNLGAVDRVIKLMERRARLLGIDAPQRIAPTDPGGREPYSDPSQMSDADRTARILTLIERARQRDGGG